MTVLEFKNEFNILYDSISSSSAPALDDYEISVFLTRAQDEIVKNKFEKYSNKLQRGFEDTTKRRNELKNLIKGYSSTLEDSTSVNIESSSQFFIVPSNILYIIQESAIVDNTDCGTEDTVSVVPKTHDEYNVQKDNPFKKPDDKEIWRLDYNSLDAGNNVVELISKYNVTKYNVRYIKQPLPIIVSDLTTFGEGLSIEGLTAASTSQLEPTVHKEILDRAVEMAITAYRENNLKNFVEINTRNE